MTASLSAVAVLAASVVTAAPASAGQSYTDWDSVPEWAKTSVESLVDAGVFDGKGSFNASTGLNRAELAKIAMKAAGLAEDTAGAPHFSDVAATDWFYAAVETLFNNDVVGGINGGATDADGRAKYDPTGTVNRAAAAKILVNAFDLETAYAGTPPNFPDVAKGAWYFDYVETAYAHGLLGGYADGKFGPNDVVTRAQIAKMSFSGKEANAGNIDKRDGYKAGKASDHEPSTTGDDNNDDEEPTTPTAPTSDGSLNVEIAANTPAGATLPQKANVEVATWDFTASSAGDVTVTTVVVKHGGIGSRDEVAALVLKDGEGNRISKSKTSINSDDEVTFTMLNGGMKIKSGSTEQVKLIITTKTSGQHNFFIEDAEAVSSNAKSVKGSFPATSKTMEFGTTEAGSLELDEDGTVASVKVGETDATIGKFKLTNGNKEDVLLTAITMKEIGSASEEDAVSNLKLMNGGEVIATGTLNDKYMSFVIEDGVLIKEGKNEKFQITADIIGEAGKQIQIDLDATVDIEGKGKTYKFGAGVTEAAPGFTHNAVKIEAGAITLTKTEPTDKIRKDKDDVVLATVNVVVNSGSDIEMESFNATIATTGQHVGVLYENIELYDVAKGSAYDLSDDGNLASNSEVVYDRDLGIVLQSGKTYSFQVRADTKDTVNINGTTTKVSFANIGNGVKGTGIEFKEQQDDQYVSDVTPSSLSFKTIDGQTTSYGVNVIALSATKNAVVGTDDVTALEFEVEESDGISDLSITEMTIEDMFAGADFNSDLVSSVGLYTVSGSTETLVKSESGSQIAGEEVTFDNLKLKVTKDSKLRFRVKVSLVDDDTKNGKSLRLKVKNIDVEDDESDDITYPGLGADGAVGGGDDVDYESARTVAIKGTGILFVAVDNTDTETDQAKWALAGTKSPFLASFEMKGENEEIKLKDLEIKASGSDLDKIASSMILYKKDKTTVIATESVTSQTVKFDNIDYVVGETAENLYLKLELNAYGKDKVGMIDKDAITFELNVTDAEGNSSNNDLAVSNGVDAGGDGKYDSGEIYYDGDTVVNGSPKTKTAVSNQFGILATQITAVSLEKSAGGVSLASNISNGSNNAAIIKITTAATSNNEENGDAIKTFLKEVSADYAFSDAKNGGAGSSVDSATIERISGSTSNTAPAKSTDTGATDELVDGKMTFDMDTLGVDAEIEPGKTAFFLVKFSTNDLDGESGGLGYIQIDLDNLDATNFDFVDSDKSGAATKTALRLDYSKLDGVKINENN